MQYGVANRPLRNKDKIIKRYNERLEQNTGKTFKKSCNMEVPSLTEKEYLLDRIQVEQKKLQHKIKRLSDKKLDTLVLPHPLMGKMPVKELLIWSAHHVDHHLATLKSHYKIEPSEPKT